jgi:hypothetical protein
VQDAPKRTFAKRAKAELLLTKDAWKAVEDMERHAQGEMQRKGQAGSVQDTYWRTGKWCAVASDIEYNVACDMHNICLYGLSYAYMDYYMPIRTIVW